MCHISLLDCKYVQVKRAAKMEVPLPLLHLKSLRTRVFVSGPTISGGVVGSLVRTGVRTLRCNKGRFISQLVELRGDGGDVDHVEILPV